MPVGRHLKFGFHTSVGGKNDGITADYFLPLDSAGLPIIIKSIGDFGIIQEVMELSRASGVKHVAAYRDANKEYFVPNYDLDPQEAWSTHWFGLIQNLPPEYLTSDFYRANVILHVINEVDKNRSDWIGWFCLAGAEHAVEAGYRFGFPSFSTGEPEPEHWETPGMLAFLDYAGHHKANVVIDLHEYSLDIDDIWAPRDDEGDTGLWHVGRFVDLLNVCDAHDIPHPLITIGEFGWEENDIPAAFPAMADIVAVQKLYGYYDNLIGAFIWYLGPWHDSMDLANKTHKLIKPVAHEALLYEGNEMQTEPNTIKHTTHILPQDTTGQELVAVAMHLHATRSMFTYSHDVIEATMFHSTPNGKIVAWDPERWDFDLEQRFAWLGVNYEVRHFSELEGIEPLPDPEEFEYKMWPVLLTPDISQYWAEHPLNYSGYCDDDGLCLPGHGGIDIPVPRGTPVYAVHDGVAYRVHHMPTTHDFGNHVYIYNVEHNELTGYAHLLEINADLVLGDNVEAGDLLGWADNTGHSYGHHVHFLRKRINETYIDDHGAWPYDLHDPSNLLQPLAPELFVEQPEPPESPGTIYDLVAYFTVEVDRGVLYEVQTQYIQNGNWVSGPQQRHQTHMEDGAFYHTKGGDGPSNPSEWEQLQYDSYKIYRYVDTSMGNGRYYTLQDIVGQPWSAWCARFMGVGSTFARYPYVNVYSKSDCQLVSKGRDNTLIRLEAVHGTMTFFTGITLTNVIRLDWLRLDGTVLESYYYAIGYGLVGWENPATRSAISEIHTPGSRPDNAREVIDCLSD